MIEKITIGPIIKMASVYDTLISTDERTYRFLFQKEAKSYSSPFEPIEGSTIENDEAETIIASVEDDIVGIAISFDSAIDDLNNVSKKIGKLSGSQEAFPALMEVTCSVGRKRDGIIDELLLTLYSRLSLKLKEGKTNKDAIIFTKLAMGYTLEEWE